MRGFAAPKLPKRLTGGFARLATSPAGPALLSLLLMAAILQELRHVDIGATWFHLPASPLFWIGFNLYFWGSPAIEWLIMRRLWNAPFSGFWAVIRKMIYNELVLSYLGDAYFFAWIRRALPHVEAPFRVVKDMAIISAFMGSAVTVAAIAVVWPLVPKAEIASLGSPLILCLALAVGSGGLIVMFRKTLLGLSRQEIAWIGGLYGLRLIGQAAAAILMWRSLLPAVGIGTWLLLSAVRLVSTRLPLVPSKDLAFAAVAVALVGAHNPVAPMIVLITSLILLANVLLGGILSVVSWASLLSGRRAATA